MIRLNVDRISNKIRGYENVNKFLQLYSDDILVEDDQIEILKYGFVNLYYINGEIVKDDTIKNPDEELIALKRESFELNAKVQDKDAIIEALLTDSFEEKKIEIQNAKERLAEIDAEMQAILKERSERAAALYLEDNRKLDTTVDPIYYSSVCLLIKNENKYLKEWVDHYLRLGFDHIYIYDNGSTEFVNDVLVVWYEQEILDKITVIEYSTYRENLQTECYNDFLQTYGKDTRWVLFADSDEFLRIADYVDINDFLKYKEDYTAIHVDFIEYGADGQEEYEDRPVKERFTSAVDVNEGIYVKDIVQPVRISSMRTHYPMYNPNKHLVFEKNKDIIVIDHYYTKSWEEWLEKMERGSCDPNYLKKLNEFFIYNPDMAYLKDGAGYSQPYGPDAAEETE